MITLDEAIIHAEEVAEENENVVNTGTFEDGHTVAEIYCDDTECINAHLSRCAECAEKHRQLAEWLKDYKRLLEQESKTGHWISGHKETGALGITYTEKICSNCGWNHSLVIPKNYCPNCGIKMVESEE